MIRTITPTCIDGSSLKHWLVEVLESKGVEKNASIIPQPRDAKGESRFFCIIDDEDVEPITIDELLARVVTEHSRGPYIHFYAKDVVSAACGAGVLVGDWFWLNYER